MPGSPHNLEPRPCDARPATVADKVFCGDVMFVCRLPDYLTDLGGLVLLVWR